MVLFTLLLFIFGCLKQIQSILFYEFKMRQEAVETAYNINQGLPKELSMNIQFNIDLKNFIKEEDCRHTFVI